MKTKKLTNIFIVVPTLNSYKILPKLINSLENQSFKNWRLLFVDGNSSKKHRNFLIKTCSNNRKLNYIIQDKKNKGIYGAMNQGLKNAKNYEWVLFWGSDDWATSTESLNDLIFLIENQTNRNLIDFPDLIISNGCYVNNLKNKRIRISRFNSSKKVLSEFDYRQGLFFGSIPPHQATLFGPKALDFVEKFDDNIKITADLDFFLKLRYKKRLKILISNLDLVTMSDDGISARNTKQRIFEVINTYYSHYKFLFIVPLFLRYLKKFLTLIDK